VSQAEIAERRVNVAKARFLEVYAQCGNVSAAAKEAGVGRRTVYDWLVADVDYQVAFNDARDQAVDVLELEAHRRAVVGVQRPVYQGGRLAGVVTDYSDKLLETLLRAARPEKYRERTGVDLNVTGVDDHRAGAARFRAQFARLVAEQPDDLTKTPTAQLVEEVIRSSVPRMNAEEVVSLIKTVFDSCLAATRPTLCEALREALQDFTGGAFTVVDLDAMTPEELAAYESNLAILAAAASRDP
jgi:enamine deaminase RidA (YjgF/YER057c/UK114 family)